uniref:tRNA-uridine aminocarboxypropyltransferase 1 n=1 Tax=Glossina brevipalpis TaxID=37001 RepID=A0A1A9WGG2_9MUSC
MSGKVKSRKYPFANMRLADYTVLDSIEGRHDCSHCHRSRKFFCYNCYIPMANIADIIPKVNLPIDIDIIKHKKEIDGKSTAIHAAVLAPHHVTIYTYPNIPDYKENREDVILIFPSAQSITVPQLFERKVKICKENTFDFPKGYNVGTLLKWRMKEVIEDDSEQYRLEYLPLKKAIFIDSTWNQSRSIYKDERIKCLKSVVLQNRSSQFWRHQKNSPRWYLATIEAIHQFLLELHINAWGLNANYNGLKNLEIDDSLYKIAQILETDTNNVEPTAPYNGQYDNLIDANTKPAPNIKTVCENCCMIAPQISPAIPNNLQLREWNQLPFNNLTG